MPDRCGGKAGNKNQPPFGGNKNTGGPGGSQGTGNWAPCGSGAQPRGQKNANSPYGGGAKIQDRTPHPWEIKDMPRDPRARAGLTRLGPPPQVRAL